jgi:uncharacterized protein (DUF1330 family)
LPAYMIVIAQIADREAFLSGYAPAAAKLVAQFGGRYVLRAPGAALLEGRWGDGASVVISEWPSRRAAETFWKSPEYAEVKRLRDRVCEAQVLLIEGQLA